jgi:plastocyanin
MYSTPTLSPTPGKGRNAVSIAGMAFSPATLTVPVNTTVTWTNNDAVAHTVTSTTALFDSGSFGSNGIYSYTFTAAGTYNYYCTVYPMMTGKIIVQ